MTMNYLSRLLILLAACASFGLLSSFQGGDDSEPRTTDEPLPCDSKWEWNGTLPGLKCVPNACVDDCGLIIWTYTDDGGVRVTKYSCECQFEGPHPNCCKICTHEFPGVSVMLPGRCGECNAPGCPQNEAEFCVMNLPGGDGPPEPTHAFCKDR